MSLTYNEQKNNGETRLDFSKEKEFLFKVDNTLQNVKNIEIHETDLSGNIASTDLTKIYLNLKEIKQLSNDDYFSFLAYTKGFNYHELAHILYTKYGNLNNSSLNRAINLLEDQRIETLFSNKYAKTRDYFRMLSLGYVLKDGMKADDYLLLYGRRFIIGKPDIIKDLRSLCKDKYGEFLVRDAERIIDTYLVTFDRDEQIKLAREFADLFPYTKSKQPQVQVNGNGKKSVTKDEKQQTEDIKEKLEEEKEKPQEEQKNNKSPRQKVEDAIDETKEKIEEDIENQKELMDKCDFDDTGDSELNESSMVFTPEQKHTRVMNLLKNQIKKIRNDLDNKTVYNQKKGKLNMRKAFSNEGYQITDFKRFIPERLSKTKLAVSILIDSSGSMHSRNYETALSSGWAIATALEDSGSKVKVYEFSTGYKVLKDFDTTSKNASWGRNYNGGTNPFDAYQDATNSIEKICKRDNIENKLIIIITDGQFSGTDKSETEKLSVQNRKKGINTTVFYVGTSYYGSTEYLFGKDMYNKIIALNTFDTLVKSVTELIKSIQRIAVNKVKLEVQ